MPEPLSDPHPHPGPDPRLPPASAESSGWLLACLCAQWCTTCEAYRATFADVATRHPGVRFVWIDIETHSDALGDDALDIENFPTVMLLPPGARAACFLGTLLPHASTLERLVRAGLEGSLGPVAAPPALVSAVAALAGRLPRA